MAGIESTASSAGDDWRAMCGITAGVKGKP
jgi:hypothetical protein